MVSNFNSHKGKFTHGKFTHGKFIKSVKICLDFENRENNLSYFQNPNNFQIFKEWIIFKWFIQHLLIQLLTCKKSFHIVVYKKIIYINKKKCFIYKFAFKLNKEQYWLWYKLILSKIRTCMLSFILVCWVLVVSSTTNIA